MCGCCGEDRAPRHQNSRACDWTAQRSRSRPCVCDRALVVKCHLIGKCGGEGPRCAKSLLVIRLWACALSHASAVYSHSIYLSSSKFVTPYWRVVRAESEDKALSQVGTLQTQVEQFTFAESISQYLHNPHHPISFHARTISCYAMPRERHTNPPYSERRTLRTSSDDDSTRLPQAAKRKNPTHASQYSNAANDSPRALLAHA